jgi:two-component system, cell cycle sensor histidine kinase and response regulator CckA
LVRPPPGGVPPPSISAEGIKGMTRKSGDRPLKELERRFQALRDQVGALPEAGRSGLETALHEVSQAIAALEEAGGGPPAEAPDCPAAVDSRALADAMLRHVFRAIPDMLTVIDRDFNIIMSNWHESAMVPEEARQGQPKCYRVFHHRDRPCKNCHVRKVFASGQPQKTEKINLLDGKTREFSAFPVLSESGQVILAAEHVRDVTGCHLAAKALRESEERFRAIFEAAQDAIFIKDRSLRYTQVNPAMERLFDQPAADLIGKTDKDLFGATTGARIRAEDRRVLRGAVVVEANTRLVRGEPRVFHVVKVPLHDDAGQVVGVCGIARDISDLKQTEEALKESEERFKLLFTYAPDIYYLMDLQGNFLDVNLAAVELTGYGREELIGKNYQDLPLFDERQNALVAGLFQNVVDGEILGPLELDLHRKDGGKLVIEAKGLALQRQGEGLLLGIARDITARKQTEEELVKHHRELQETTQRLEQSRNMLELIMESIPVRVFWKDRDLRYIGCNSLFARDAGFQHPEQLLGQDDFSMNWREQAEAYRADDRQVMESRRPTLNLVEEQTTPAGTRIWLKTSKVPLQLPNGEVFGVLGIYEDVTAHKEAEEALEKREATLRTLIEANPESLFLLDTRGVILAASHVAAQRIDKTLEEVIGAVAFALVSNEIGQKRFEIFQQVVASGTPARFEDIRGNFHLDISMTPIFDQDKVVQVAVLAVDISRRKLAEAALRESEQRFRLMAETIQDVFWIDTPSFDRIIYVSPAYEQVWGRSCQELDQHPHRFVESIHPEDRDRALATVAAAREKGSPSDQEYRIVKPDGAVRWIHDRGFPIRDDQGRVTLFTGVARDITEQKALEQQLLQAQKMEAVGRLAGGIAHDFNNLLMAITGYGELMRSKVLKDDPLYGYLENILKAGDRATALTQQLLTFSRQKVIHPQAVDLNRVIMDLEPMLRRLIGEDIDLEVVTDGRPGAVKADPGQLGQIVMNLVVNARDAMPQGGRLTLKTGPVNFTVGCHNRFGLTPPGAYVLLEVQDAGVGMDEATQAHVFEPFFTTKEPGKGTGLGLSTVYGIVKQSEGYLDLESSPGAGSTFTIYLPRLEGGVEPAKAKIPVTAHFRGEDTILLVEDEDVLRGLLAKFLRLYGYTVLEARHGGEALLTCERHPGPIHLMVTDVVMPQMSGRELADRLAPLRPEMQIIYMSGYTEEALVQHDVADLSVAFLQKPFKPVELARRVRAVLHPPVSR